MARIVVNPDTLIHLKASFNTQSTNLDTLTRALQSDVDNTQEDWQGNVPTMFRNDWHTQYAPMLQKLAAALVDAGRDVDTALQNALHADQQA
ncbi:WXG100 family type VII secretion target [Frankia sp. AgB1.9]|uniref:ESAT-6-like protein n=1 Tax=Pseudofrankia inefficax (strain DSM 45817 / CECT 9037 / DDB 130130 / EuI1c) TaxID=298654 RepID=E3IYY5_PSEI1|nr:MULTISPECIES: WXG100 family type VII secretion target [Frankiaceae]ADP80268.1 hypothetical protein FraEuI1c_2229 [Pseudofrankia inefficax]MBL7486806.1 WXG100 family type VII secretion target [Frankia sp. AgW1.1]MBL7553873.1 WXG100 family type VII secretion target [Frankia sp. AgB1.9]MBL7618124.1 WXG100 family type VII secretion target [Frankia sp. AgB1.8]